MVDPEHRPSGTGPAADDGDVVLGRGLLLDPGFEREAGLVEGAEGAEVDGGVVPLKLSAPPNRPGAQVAPLITPGCPFPDASVSVAPDPSSNPYAATIPVTEPQDDVAALRSARPETLFEASKASTPSW